MPCCEGVISHKPSGKNFKLFFLMIPCRYPEDTRWVSWEKKEKERDLAFLEAKGLLKWLVHSFCPTSCIRRMYPPSILEILY
jgi:hypothetical protein